MSTPSTEVTATGVTDERLAGLRRWNLGLALLHLAQAIAIVVIASDFAITVTSSFPAGPPGSEVPPPDALFDVRIGWAIAVFLGLAALDHLLTATAVRGTYEARPAARDQPLPVGRVLVQRDPHGGADRLLLRHHGHHRGDRDRRRERRHDPVRVAPGADEPAGPFPHDDAAVLVRDARRARPWAAMTVNLVGADEIPGFVIGIYVSLFLFFMSFGLNQWLQYRGVGPWRDYAYGEKAYLVLSLAAKSALAWQIFGGSLAD
jgi:hypothetical protein